MKKSTVLGFHAKMVALVLTIVVFEYFRTGIHFLDAVLPGPAIELYTPKTIYQPQELVTIYALVTYNGEPVACKDVAFQVNGPKNPFYNFTAISGSRTNSSGIAEFSFRIPWPDVNPEASVLGTWVVFATVEIADQVVMDTLNFKVAWIVELVSIETLNSELAPEDVFLRQEIVIFNVTLKNHAATERVATIAINVQDSANYPIMEIEIINSTLQPGENVLYASGHIPVQAKIGQAVATATAFTNLPKMGGIPCCLPVSTTFQIITKDVAITKVVPLKRVITSGEIVQIIIGVKNKGNKTESPYITAYYDNNVIGTKQILSLHPSMETEIAFNWDTSNIHPGSYWISAKANPVEGEIEIEDNTMVNGTVNILAQPPTRDVAVTWVYVQPREVEPGGIVEIEVHVKNFGTLPESFNVLLYYNDSLIMDQQVINLAPRNETKLFFLWDTSGVPEGKYTIKAYIPPSPDEVNIENNLFIDGNVTIRVYPLKVHDVAITSLEVSELTAYIGDAIEVFVNVQNLGNFNETFNVTVYYNSSEIAVNMVWSLAPNETARLNLIWNTSEVEEGVYVIWAFAEIVPDEVNTDNNRFVDGSVMLLSRPAPLKRDIAVIDLLACPTIVTVGENITVHAVVVNLGDSKESFDLTIFYDEVLLQTLHLTLTAHSSVTVVYTLDTSSLKPGIYRLWANVTILEGEINVENNRFEDATITVLAVFSPHDLITFLIPLSAIAGLVSSFIIVLYSYLRRRKRRKKQRKSYAVFVYPHI